MKYILYGILYCLTINNSFGQLIKKKEAAQIITLLKQVSEQNKPKNYLIRGSNVLTMTDSVILYAYDVLIVDGKIQEIGRNIVPSVDFEILDGSGKYLMPGLTDMHIHLFDHHQMKNTWMLLLLLNGVTSVRDMAGEPGKLILRDQIRNNEVLAPNIYQAGPIINGIGNQFGFVVATTPETGRIQVRDQKELGYDLIKIYNDLNPEVYWAIIDEAAKKDMIVAGHVPYAIKLSEALNAMSSIEHLTGYKNWEGKKAYLGVDPDYAIKTATSKTWNCPTFYNLMMNWGSKENAEEALTNSIIADHLPSNLKKRWKQMIKKNSKRKMEIVKEFGDSNRKLFSEITLNLYQENAKLIAGTDAGSLPLMVPGFTLHKELEYLIDLGIPICDVLKMTTINAAHAMERENEFGSVEVGKRADLLLLHSNPLEDIKNLQDQNGLFIRGIWLSSSELEYISSEIKIIFGNM